MLLSNLENHAQTISFSQTTNLQEQVFNPELSKIITKNSSDAELRAIESFYKKENVKVIFLNVKRNRAHEIIKLKVKISYNQNKIEFATQDNSVITPFKIDGIKNQEKVSLMFLTKISNSDAKNTLLVNKNILVNNSNIIAQQNLNEKSVHDKLFQNIIFRFDNDESEFKHQTLILQKQDNETKDNSNGITYFKNLIAQTNVNLDEATLFLNNKPASLENLSAIQNQDALKIIISYNNESLNKKNVVEVFQNEFEIDDSSKHKNIFEAIKKVDELKKEMPEDLKRTTQIELIAKKNSNFSDNQNKKTTNEIVTIQEVDLTKAEEKNKKVNFSKTDTIHGKKVITNNLLNKSGYVIKATTSNNELNAYKELFERESIQMEFKDVKRNKFKMITAFEISLKSEDDEALSVWFTENNSKGIPDIFVGRINGKLTIVSIE